jgi:S-adenosylmethionine decarboxylase
LESLGTHALVRVFNSDFDKLNCINRLREAFEFTVLEHGLVALSDPILHQFDPQGLTGIILLAESHLSIHTWPEKGEAAIDVFTCGGRPSSEIASTFCKHLGCPTYNIKEVER